VLRESCFPVRKFRAHVRTLRTCRRVKRLRARSLRHTEPLLCVQKTNTKRVDRRWCVASSSASMKMQFDVPADAMARTIELHAAGFRQQRASDECPPWQVKLDALRLAPASPSPS
jgi:hypothetical protein